MGIGDPCAGARPPATSDEALLDRFVGGAEEALGILYLRYASRLLAIAARAVDRATAEEIVQDVFLAVWRKADTYDAARGTVRRWIFRIARNRLINELRDRRRRPGLDAAPDGWSAVSVVDDDPDVADIVSRNATRSMVRAALRELPDDERRAVTFAFLREMSHGRVATELRLPLGTVKTRIRNGLRRLRGHRVLAELGSHPGTRGVESPPWVSRPGRAGPPTVRAYQGAET